MKSCMILVVSLLLAGGCMRPRVSRPRSDVRVTADIGWWSYQEELEVTALDVEVLEAPLNLFGNRALIRFRLRGQVWHSKGGWRPYIRETQISQRFRSGEDGARFGDIEVTPIVGVKEDKLYHGEQIAFDYKVEQIVHTFQWGKNEFLVHSAGQERELELHQYK